MEVDITVKRYVLDGSTKVTDPSYSQTLTILTSDTAAKTLANLPAYGAVTVEGKNIVGAFHYYVEEKANENFTVTYSADGGTTTVSNGIDAAISASGMLTVTNTKVRTLTVVKNWNVTDEAQKIPVQFKLWQQGVPKDPAGSIVQKTFGPDAYTLNAENGWKLTIKNLPAEDDTYTYTYYVEEITTGYDVAYTNNSGIIDGTITITNTTPNVPTTKLTVIKQYAQGSLTQPAVEVQLIRSITENNVTLTEVVSSYKLTAGENWTYTWENQPMAGSITVDGQTVKGDYTFSVREVVPQGFVATYSTEGGVVANDGTVTIVNAPTQLTIEKAFTNLSGTTPTTRTSISYKLMQYKVQKSGGEWVKVDGSDKAYPDDTLRTLTKDSGWTATIKELPLTWVDGTTGLVGEYRYYVVETDSTGKEAAAHYTASAQSGVKPSTQAQNITITNTETEVSVKKIWSINGGVLPEELPTITLELRRTQTKFGAVAGDEVVATVALNAKSEGVTQSKDANGNVFWTYTWRNLDAYGMTEDGKVTAWYYYVVETDEPKGFHHVGTDMNNTGSVTGNTPEAGVITITNELITYTLPETGGAGTTPYTIGGLLLMMAATVLLYQELQRKRRAGNSGDEA